MAAREESSGSHLSGGDKHDTLVANDTIDDRRIESGDGQEQLQNGLHNRYEWLLKLFKNLKTGPKTPGESYESVRRRTPS